MVETEKEALEMLSRLDKGEDFAELAKKHSQDSGSKEQGGDLGFFPRGEMVKEFEDAAFALAVGERSEPVKTIHGYHVIETLEHKEGRKVTYEEAVLSLIHIYIINYKEGPIDEQILELTGGEGVDVVIIAGANVDILKTAVKIVKPGGTVSNVNYYGEGDVIPIPRLDWGSGMAHKKIIGGLTPGGRVRMERLIDLVMAKRIDLSKLVTHTFDGFDNIKDALLLMKDKPKDLIKPVVII